VLCYFDGWKIVETRDGSGNVKEQLIHGTQGTCPDCVGIDEIVMMWANDKGDLYVHSRRAGTNWNVIALTDLGGSVVERYVYEPYGQVTVYQETAYGDRDGDGLPLTRRNSAQRWDAQRLAGEGRGAVSMGDVDAADKGTVGTTCTGTVSGPCRILDLDPAVDSAGAAPRPACGASAGKARPAVSMVHGDYDASDATLFDSLPQGLARHPGRPSSGVAFPFAHQGLYLDPELGSYQNRVREYAPGIRRFLQRDPRRKGAETDQYFYASLSPSARVDPMGLQGTILDWCGNVCDSLPLPDGTMGTVDDLRYFAVSVCCWEYTDQYCPPGSGPLCGLRCRGQICTGTRFANEHPQVQQCMLEHEAVHLSDMGCDWHSYECNYYGCEEADDFHWGNSECRAYKRLFNCLRNTEHHNTCKRARCFIDRLCGPAPDYAPGDVPDIFVEMAIADCRADASGWFFYPGCEQSEPFPE